ncbi:LLM class flavin-dependent oxidoreductase [Phyllobacterium sp. YR531]|uniref:LLM class flavin-dependent oxidoreductase n=1 Tax=Phyllobacterium sp. YR531 TaxID=1144343 RepID=UPI00026F523E|nr:LLM class flavin-dependent oxidoreductase [Phyllobacterium sp. YR531]EJN04956.1 flavin-dependent oxidoreductase, methylene-tetrahydromethanopterin reductase [Phyllobacterium sp. YR531]
MMHLGISITPFGHHPGAWQKNGSSNSLQLNRISQQVKQAQDAKFDFALFADNSGIRPVGNLTTQVPFEPTTLISALATVAHEIGLIASAAIDQHEPYNLARRFASLDTISHGRAGWNLIASASVPKSAEYIDVVSGLWDSWEDDAFIYDKAKGRLFLPEKMHVLDHAGENFTVRGPLNVNRSEQGKPVIATLLQSQTLEIAAQKAEVIFIDVTTSEELKSNLSDLQRAFDRNGRNRRNVRILANVVPYVSTSEADANKLRQELDGLASNVSLSGIELIGTAQTIADHLEELAERVDGFTILPAIVSDERETFVESVIPELRNRGLFRDDYTGKTLRDHLGLPRPAHPAAIAPEHSL